MIYYIVLILIIISRALIKNDKSYCFFIGILLILFAGLRANFVGPDTSSYQYSFNETQKFGLENVGFFFAEKGSNKSEPGYNIFQYLLGFFVNYNVFKFLCVLIQVIPAIYIIYKYSVNKCISFIIYFCLPVYTMMSMSMMRQGIAFGIFLMGFHYLIERNLKKYCLSIGVAFLFHSTSIILLPLYFLYAIPYKRIYNWIIAIIIIVAYVFKTLFFQILASYSRMQYESVESGGLKMFIFFILLFCCSLFINERKIQNPFIKIQLYLLVFTTVFWVVGMSLSAAFRLAAYTEFFLCLYIPNVLGLIKYKKLRLFSIITSCLVCILIMEMIVLKVYEYDSYYPYYFIWEER